MGLLTRFMHWSAPTGLHCCLWVLNVLLFPISGFFPSHFPSRLLPRHSDHAPYQPDLHVFLPSSSLTFHPTSPLCRNSSDDLIAWSLSWTHPDFIFVLLILLPLDSPQFSYHHSLPTAISPSSFLVILSHPTLWQWRQEGVFHHTLFVAHMCCCWRHYCWASK